MAAIPLNASWSLHNVIAWMKIKPFLSKNVSRVYIITIILAQPYWILEIYANFTYFHGVNDLFLKTRPWEALCRDPWWIVTTVYLFVIIKTQYEMTFREIISISPRFAVMLLAMVLSIIFIVVDIFAVTKVLRLGGRTGISKQHDTEVPTRSLLTLTDPFWKLAFVFKCLTDSVVLDDFKTALDRLRAFKMSRLGSFSADMSDRRNQNNGMLVATWERIERGNKQEEEVHSPDGDYIHSSNFPWKPEQARRPHKDSVVSRDHWRDPNIGLAPEDVVPSAIEDIPMRRIGSTSPTLQKPQHHFIDDLDSVDERDFGGEAGYAEAMREVQRDSLSSNHRRSKSPPHG